jgi:hypothetical protein
MFVVVSVFAFERQRKVEWKINLYFLKNIEIYLLDAQLYNLQ